MKALRPFALCLAVGALALAAPPSRSADETPPKGLRVFSAGHSFHMFMPAILADTAKGAGIKDHKQVGKSGIGGSRTIQHWDQPDDKNKTKAALKEGNVDVLTLSPIYHPDEGIDNFVKLGLEHNPNLRVTVQASWLPYDAYDPDYQKKKRPDKVDREARTAEEMKALHAKYAKTVDEQVIAINKKYDRPVVFVVPVGQAAILLRGKIIEGKAPGLKKQEELFTDAIGHPTEPLRVLNAYCHYAVIYRRSPVGLPMPAALKSKKADFDEKLNALLQELAWEAVTAHPLSGVKK